MQKLLGQKMIRKWIKVKFIDFRAICCCVPLSFFLEDSCSTMLCQFLLDSEVNQLCYAQSLSHVQHFATPWTAARQALLSMGFSRQEYWSGLPCPPPGDLPSPGIEIRQLSLQADSLPFKPPGKPKNTGEDSLSLLQGSSRPRNRTGVSCTAGKFFTN